MSNENIKNLNTALNYYSSMINKDFTKMGSYLAANIHFISPLAQLTGKEAVVEAAKNLTKVLDNIEIRAKFSSDTQVMLAYDFIFSKLDLNLRASVLLDFSNDLISRIELFYDSKPFENIKNNIFQDPNK